MNEIIKSFNKQLSVGQIPNQLNYNPQPACDIDWDKVKYNSFYKSYEFAESKFPAGYESIPGFEKIIEKCIPKISPLEEIEMKQNKYLYK